MSKIWLVLVPIAFTVGCSINESYAQTGGAQAMPAEVRDAAWRCAAGQLRSQASQIDLAAAAAQLFPVTGVTLYRHTFFSRDNGGAALCDIDSQAAEADEHVLAEAERVAYVARYGRLDPQLRTIVATMTRPEDRRWILIYVPVDEPFAGAGSNLLRDPEAAAAEHARLNAAVAAAMPRILALLPDGTPVSPPSDGSPFFLARLGAADIASLSQSNEIGNLYDGEDLPRIPLGIDTCRVNQIALTNADQAHTQYGLTGKNVKLATLEMVCQNPYLPFDPMDPAHAEVTQSCNDPADHGASVLGYIANKNPSDPELAPPNPLVFGMAPDAELFSANGSSFAASFAWMAAKGIAIANYSFFIPINPNVCPIQQSTVNVLSDYYATHAPYILSVAGAGNDGYPGGCAKDNVFNILLNGIVVGPAFAHMASVPPPAGYCAPDPNNPNNQLCYNYVAKDKDRTLDWIPWVPGGNFWVWVNPQPGWGYLGVGDLELPHMVAYASGMRYSLSPVFCEAGGTSFAAPQVTGAAALLSQQNGALYGRPEALKAILMAGADVNVDLDTPALGAAYSFQPVYKNIGGADRHGGVGLLNVLASAQMGATRLLQNNRYGVAFDTALANVSSNIVAYQQTLDRAIQMNQSAPGLTGYDYGSMDPASDFYGIWYKNYYYFVPAQSGNLRIVLTWNRPYTCTFGQVTTCGPNWKPDLNMVLRDVTNNPAGSVSHAHTWDPNEEFMAAPVVAGHVYRLDIYKQNYWPGPESFGLASYFTTNSQ